MKPYADSKNSCSANTAARGFRTCDLLHVAQAHILGRDTFWGFDEKANALAALEGLTARPAAS